MQTKIYNAQGQLLELFEEEKRNKNKDKTNKITMIYGNAMIEGSHTWEFGQGISKKEKDDLLELGKKVRGMC